MECDSINTTIGTEFKRVRKTLWPEIEKLLHKKKGSQKEQRIF